MKNNRHLVFWSVLMLASSLHGQVVSFTNSTPIIFPVGAPTGMPYPSTISVSNIPGQIVSLSVTLRNMNHPVPDDFDILLVGPNNQKVLLMSDAGGNNALSDVGITFAQTRPMLPDSDRILSGSYQPSNYDSTADLFPGSAPPGPYGTDLSVCNGSSPNGLWRLYVYDDMTAAFGSIAGGWHITFNVQGPLTIVEHPQDETALPGDDVTLRVTAFGSSSIFYQWRLNGAPLPGQTNSTVTFSNVQATSGGRFDARVYTDTEGLTSESALLFVAIRNALNATDDFRSRPTSSQRQGHLQGDSRAATFEPHEPIPYGGGKSVWFEWTSPNNGIATLTTRGSAFDTWLSVFTGTVVSNLAYVTQDDDRGGFYTSTLQFNAVEGKTYQIALDGFGANGNGGLYNLQWDLQPTTGMVPVIVSNPQPQVVSLGGNATFRVLVDSPSVTFQWMLNGAPIPGATGPVLNILNADSDDVGMYTVMLIHPSGQTSFSAGVAMELGSDIGGLTQGDLEKHQTSGRPVAGFFKDIALGAPVWKHAQAPAGNPPCNLLWGLPQGLKAVSTGVILVETTGSPVAAQLAVFAGYHEQNEVPLKCGPLGNPSMVAFNAVAGGEYVVEVLGANVANVKLTNTLGVAPAIPNAPTHCLVAPNGSIVLNMPANSWVPAPACRWRRNNSPITGANQTTLLVNNFDVLKEGMYSVVMSNFVRSVTNNVAYLQMGGDFVLDYALLTNGFRIAASNATPFMLVTTTNLTVPWIPLATNQDACTMLIFTNADALLEPRRFFRAVPWPPAGP